jgi:adenylate cyclase
MLLDTYIGSVTAQRILAGNVRRGHAESLEVALLLCDLRGFTELSNRLPSARVLQLLDVYFDQVVPTITKMGGEVLKFMGDSVLAFFHRDSAEAAAAVAVKSAVVALRRLARVSLPDADLQAGIALHYGKVSYGNIGSGKRLDFTLIGPDVNLVSRIQASCNSGGQLLLMSQRFAGLLDSTQTIPVGPYRLRGFAAPAQLYTLRDPHRTMRLRPAVRIDSNHPRGPTCDL